MAAEAPQLARLRARMGDKDFQQLQEVFARLDGLAADPSRGRRLRKLERPEAVTFSYTGVKTAGSGTFKPEGNGEYAGEITGLKEDVRFVIKAEDSGDEDGYVHQLAVKRSHRNLGIGRALLVEAFRGFHRLGRRSVEPHRSTISDVGH